MSIIMLTNSQQSSELETNIQDICKPLFESPIFQDYKINYFTYSRYFLDGSLYFLSTNGSLCKYHFNKKYDLIPRIESNFIDKKTYYLPFLNDPLGNSSENFKKEIFDFQELFQMHCPIFFLEKNANYLDIYMYGSQSRSLQIVNFYYNHLSILEKFNMYFKSQAFKLIKEASENKISIPEKMQKNCIPIFQENGSITKDSINQKLTAPRKILEGKHAGNYLTKSESEILQFITKGYSAKEIASLLNISPKTIDSHLCNIKYRLQITRKHELFKIAAEIL